MGDTVTACVRGRVLEPVNDLELPEGTLVHFTITSTSPPDIEASKKAAGSFESG